MEAEETQEHGRQGVALFKRWLESTTYIDLNWNVYEKPQFCTLPLLNGRKKYDLVGEFIGADQRPLAVECKRYATPGDQAGAFKRFLAESYSSTLKELQDRGGDLQRDFAWATTHPFAVTSWSTLHTSQSVKRALLENLDVLADDADKAMKYIDEIMLTKVAERIWLLVFNEKQDSLSLD